ncbi:hypothetical protein [Desulfonema magnum]|nr:hypothetical protein [Desulfonema magnum]
MTQEPEWRSEEKIGTLLKENSEFRAKPEYPERYFANQAGKVGSAEKQKQRAESLQTSITEALTQIRVCVQDIETITGEEITHKEKNAALWLVTKRLMRLSRFLEMADAGEIPF